MNSFWIPALGGQVYAMAGMTTRLHLLANDPGVYQGSSANLSGAGFADMDFETHVGTKAEFTGWVGHVKATNANSLTTATYDRLAKPAASPGPVFYASTSPDIYNNVVMHYQHSHAADAPANAIDLPAHVDSEHAH
jgi:cytochrome o ubiquinol oxidase subunit 2